MSAEIIRRADAADSLYLRLSEEPTPAADPGRTDITRTIETSDESATVLEPLTSA